jgi:hypothetical protein
MFLALVIAFASFFSDYYEYRNNVSRPQREGKIAATYLGAASFFAMLICVLASSIYTIDSIPAIFSRLFMGKNATAKYIPAIIFQTNDKFAGIHFALPYWPFFACIAAIAICNIYVLSRLRARESQSATCGARKRCFQDIVDAANDQIFIS